MDRLRTIARASAGPAMVAGAAWCALGQLTLARPDSVGVRLAMPASLLWLPVLFSLALLVPAWRRVPLTATPALLATVPWWPLPLPAVALIWVGALGWWPIVIATAVALSGTGRGAVAPRSSSARPWRSALFAGVLTLTAASAAAWLLAYVLPMGDEPHYLLITQSLLNDGDLKVQNNYDQHDYAEYFSGAAAPDFVRRGRDGEIYSIHAPGAAILVLPAFWLFGYRGAQATVVLLAAVTGAFVWLAAWLASRDRSAAWFAWLAVAGSTTFLIQSVTVFPDGPGALAAAAAVVLLLLLSLNSATPVWLVGTSTLVAALPWLHTRFAIVAGALGGLVAWRLVTDRTRPVAARLARLGLFMLVPAISALGWFTFFSVVYGTPNPFAPYGENPGTRLAYVPGGLMGLLFDEQFGLLTYSPVLVAALGPFFMRSRASGDRPLGAALGASGVYLVAVSTYWMWWAGVPATPARFAMVVLPTLAAPIAVSWKHSAPALRAVWSTLLVTSLSITLVILAAASGTLALNTRGVHADWLGWINPVLDLSRGWPSFFWRLNPDDLGSELHFVRHVAGWVALFTASGAALVVFGRAAFQRREAHMLAAGWCVLGTLALAVQYGWWINGVQAADPARSQLAFLRAMRGDRTSTAISSLSIRPFTDVGLFQVRAIRSDTGQGGLVSGLLEDVPAGAYDIAIHDRRPHAGTLAFRIGRAREPWRTFALPGRTEQTVRLDLPGGAESLFIETDTTNSAGRTVDLIPVELDRSVTGRAVTTARYGLVDVLFCDRSVFVEDEGFWVRGGETAELVLTAPRDQRAVTLELTNGPLLNDVVVSRLGAPERLTLAKSESRALSVTLSETGATRLEIFSPEGFRPVPLGSSGDSRYLGVRVRVLEGPRQ